MCSKTFLFSLNKNRKHLVVIVLLVSYFISGSSLSSLLGVSFKLPFLARGHPDRLGRNMTYVTNLSEVQACRRVCGKDTAAAFTAWCFKLWHLSCCHWTGVITSTAVKYHKVFTLWQLPGFKCKWFNPLSAFVWPDV